MDTLTSYAVLFVAGIAAGVVNVLAGGGSFLTLPILILMGLPVVVANATNRVGILLQNIGAVWRFHNHNLVQWSSLRWAALPAALGSIIGVGLVFIVEDTTFRRLLAFLMVALTLWTLWDPISRHSKSKGFKQNGWVLGVGFFLVGIYGGFVQAGVGFLILALTTYAGFDLVRGNAIKVVTILVFSIIALTIFLTQDVISWPAGVVLGMGTIIGGQIGVHLTVFKGHHWVKGFVLVAAVIFAIKLWISG